MENDSTFVAPEGVYSVTEEHKPPNLPNHPGNNAGAQYPTRLSSIVMRFPAPKQTVPGFAQLLGGNKDSKRERASKERDDGASLSSSDTESHTDPTNTDPASPSIVHESHTLFSHPPAGGKKKHILRPKHNIRTTSSTFITRFQSAEGLTKALQTKQGEISFLFYNQSKNFLWVEVASKSKVQPTMTGRILSDLLLLSGSVGTNNVFCISNLSRCKHHDSLT
jgi:hypothetical protein